MVQPKCQRPTVQNPPDLNPQMASLATSLMQVSLSRAPSLVHEESSLRWSMWETTISRSPIRHQHSIKPRCMVLEASHTSHRSFIERHTKLRWSLVVAYIPGVRSMDASMIKLPPAPIETRVTRSPGLDVVPCRRTSRLLHATMEPDGALVDSMVRPDRWMFET